MGLNLKGAPFSLPTSSDVDPSICRTNTPLHLIE